MARHHCRLVSFNIAHGRGGYLPYQGWVSHSRLRRNLSRIAELLVDLDADVVALQEVDEDSHWNGRLNLLETLRREAGYQHALMGINTRRKGAKPLAYGNAILSRFPVHFWENTPFGEATLGEKGFLYAEIEMQALHVPLINLHLDFRSRKRRIAQVEQLVDFVRERPDSQRRISPLVCGDFNTSSQRIGDAARHLFLHLTEDDHYQLYPAGEGTFPAHFPRRALDFVLLPETCHVRSARAVRRVLSDHRPVLVDFDIKPSQPFN